MYEGTVRLLMEFGATVQEHLEHLEASQLLVLRVIMYFDTVSQILYRSIRNEVIGRFLVSFSDRSLT